MRRPSQVGPNQQLNKITRTLPRPTPPPHSTPHIVCRRRNWRKGRLANPRALALPPATGNHVAEWEEIPRTESDGEAPRERHQDDCDLAGVSECPHV